MNANIKALNKELYYHPPWIEDKPIFIKFLHKSHFTDKDIILFARLYVKYSHIHCFQTSELTNYFKDILTKMKIGSSEELFNKTHIIYSQLRNNL